MTKKILIIEDEKQIMDVLRVKLQESGFDVISSGDGLDGLGKAINEKPDLILLDVILPKMDGITFLDKYNEAMGESKVPVLVLSNLDNSEKIQESRSRGAYDYLVKTDWTLDEVVAKVQAVFAE